MRFTARVEVRLREGIADPEGATIEAALPTLGYSDISGVRMGRSVRLEVEAPDADSAAQRVDALSRELLSNPVLEETSSTLEPLL